MMLTSLGPYEVVGLVGAGGMGEVYRARDTRLERTVAIKVIPQQFAQDGQRMARFHREAQVLASLNHPNIQYWCKLSIARHCFEISTEKMWMKDQKEGWFVSAASHEEKNSEAFAGQHALDSTSFYIFDESSGFSDKIFDVAEGGLTDGEPMMFLFGNPTQNSGKFIALTSGVSAILGTIVPSIPANPNSPIKR